MPVNSYLELVLTTFGWFLYNISWSLLVDTGLAYIPFISVIFRNIIEPIKSQEARAAAVTSLRRMEVEVVTMIVVIFLAVSPFFTIGAANQTITSACANPNAATLEKSDSNFNTVFGEQIIADQVVKVPPWFYLVITVSGGFNSAFISQLPCSINIRQLKTEASSVLIDNLQLRGETNRFANECYSFARSKYFFDNKLVNEEDISWLGSEYFQDEIYPTLYARGRVPPFPYDPNNEVDRSHNIDPYSHPTCDKWWGDPELGLRKRLLDSYPANALTQLQNIFNDREKTENAAIRKILQNEKQGVEELDLTSAPEFGPTDSMFSLNPLDTVADLGVGALQWGGGVVAAATVAFITNIIVMSLPLVQAIALLSVYFFLAKTLVIGGYSWTTVRTASIYIFGIKFWSSIWAVVAILDSELTTALSVRPCLHPIDFISLNVGYMAIIVNIIVAGMYVTLPSYFLLMLKWAGEEGMSVGREMSQSGTSAAGGAGKSGVGLAKGAANKGK